MWELLAIIALHSGSLVACFAYNTKIHTRAVCMGRIYLSFKMCFGMRPFLSVVDDLILFNCSHCPNCLVRGRVGSMCVFGAKLIACANWQCWLSSMRSPFSTVSHLCAQNHTHWMAQLSIFNFHINILRTGHEWIVCISSCLTSEHIRGIFICFLY